jgi:hypothetical protein
MNSLDTLKTFRMNTISPEIYKDFRTGDCYIIGAQLKPTLYNTVMKMPFENKNKCLEEQFSLLGSIPTRWKFGITGFRKCFHQTENYIVFIEPPAVVNLLRVAGTFIKGYKMMDWMDWFPQEKTRIVLMHKDTGKLRKVEYYTSQALYVTDIINSYEDCDNVSIYNEVMMFHVLKYFFFICR